MGHGGKTGYTYADLHVGMSFRSPGRTITDADLVAFGDRPSQDRFCPGDAVSDDKEGGAGAMPSEDVE